MCFFSHLRFLILLPLFPLCVCATTEGFCQTPLQAFDGSFRLETGEVITGGYFVEGGQGHYLYMDTEGLSKGGLFEAISDNRLRSLGVLDSARAEIEFIPGAHGTFDTLEWREPGLAPIRGERVYPHPTRDVTFTSEDGTRLEGRLLLPECPGPHPVVVTVHGSSPVNEIWSDFWWGWYRRNHATTPVPALRWFDGPVLWFLAERDQNVPLVSTRAALDVPSTPHLATTMSSLSSRMPLIHSSSSSRTGHTGTPTASSATWAHG